MGIADEAVYRGLAAQDAGELSRLKRCMEHQGVQTLGTAFAHVMRGPLVIAVVIMKVEVVMVLAVVVVVETGHLFRLDVVHVSGVKVSVQFGLVAAQRHISSGCCCCSYEFRLGKA